MPSHDLIDRRSLPFGRAIAARIGDNAGAFERARSTVSRWLTTCSPATRATLLEWRDALDGPAVGVVALLTSRDERATRLRQSNPFTGVLPNEERNAIPRQFRTHEPPAA